MLHWFEKRTDLEAFTRALEPMRSIVEAHLDRLDEQVGYCVGCRKISRLQLLGTGDASWRNLRESLVCPACGLNGRMREMCIAIESELAGLPHPVPTIMLERVTPLYAKVAERFPFVEGCEYVDPAAVPGSFHTVRGTSVRHENMLGLSWPDESWALVVHGDVLEHVADHEKALAECRRVLRKGGVMIFTVPFFDLESHIVRCTSKDGDLVHHFPAAFHGNPVSDRGSLVFVQHGWPLLDEVRSAGFSRVSIGILYDPFQGIVSSNSPYREGFMWPLLFRAVK